MLWIVGGRLLNQLLEMIKKVFDKLALDIGYRLLD